MALFSYPTCARWCLVAIIQHHLERSSFEDMAIPEATFKRSVVRMFEKVKNDTAIMLNVNMPDDYVLPMTNRMTVS